jgi:hypothetical protein
MLRLLLLRKCTLTVPLRVQPPALPRRHRPVNTPRPNPIAKISTKFANLAMASNVAPAAIVATSTRHISRYKHPKGKKMRVFVLMAALATVLAGFTEG